MTERDFQLELLQQEVKDKEAYISTLKDYIRHIYSMRGEDEFIRNACNDAISGKPFWAFIREEAQAKVKKSDLFGEFGP